jgi:hypothetical protein
MCNASVARSGPRSLIRAPARGSTPRPCARGSLLPCSMPKQQRRSDKQRDEEPIQGQDLGHGANRALVLLNSVEGCLGERFRGVSNPSCSEQNCSFVSILPESS